MRYFRILGWVSGLVLAVSCASTPMPTEQLALADRAIERAEGAGAAELAAGDLSTARDKLQRARDGAESGSIRAEQVERLASEAEADARLAEAQARAARAKAAVEENDATLRALEEEATRYQSTDSMTGADS